MFKKKPIYIVGIIVFTLILIADLALFFLVPTGGRGNMPNMGDSFDAGSFSNELPEGFDSEDFGGQMPNRGGFDFGNSSGEMPDMGDFDFGDFSGEMPEGMEGFSGKMPGDRDSSSLPDGFDTSSLPQSGQRDNMAGSGILATIRNAFWPILIVCILGDALCIFMLIRISKKKEARQQERDEDDDNPSRRDHTNTWLAVMAVVLVGAVILTSLPSSRNSISAEANISVVQAEANRNDIASIFSGSGTLSSNTADEVEIPVTVSVTSYAVKNGDMVQVGDVIANVDKTSVLNAIYEVQSLIDDMDAEIAEVQSDTLDDEITARADGRVKAIYVSKGDSVAAAMYENGAVMLISLGGSMTVVIESDHEVTVGQTLVVTLSDGTQIEGKVQQTRSGKITITTTDDGPAPDDTVSVATQDGTVLGTGILSVSSPLKVTGFFGTVDKIKVKVGDEVDTGDTLLTLENTDDLARYQKLLRQRKELTALISELTVMYQEGTIKAATAGIVSNIAEDVTYSQLSVTANGVYVSNLSASSSGSYGIVLLSNMTSAPSDPTEGDLPTEGDTPTEGNGPTEDNTPTEGNVPTEGSTPAEDLTPPDNSTSNQLNSTYAGKVIKVTYGAFQIQISQTDMTGVDVAALETMDEALFTVTKQYSPSLNVTVNMYLNGQTIPSSINAIQAGDRVLLRIENGAVTQIDFVAGTGTSDPSQGTAPNAGVQFPSTGGSFSYPSTTDEEEEEEAVYEVEKTSLCAIIPSETMTIDISVDELDILTLAVGQEAAITLDALPGQSFTGTVKKINPTGTNEGGSTKYTVTMEVPRTAQMLDGMNASVLIEVSRLTAVLTIPAAAIYEDGNRTYVYTSLSEKTGEPADPVDVTIGASDGTNVEILAGLKAGDTVYYSYADSIVYSFAD